MPAKLVLCAVFTPRQFRSSPCSGAHFDQHRVLSVIPSSLCSCTIYYCGALNLDEAESQQSAYQCLSLCGVFLDSRAPVCSCRPGRGTPSCGLEVSSSVRLPSVAHILAWGSSSRSVTRVRMKNPAPATVCAVCSWRRSWDCSVWSAAQDNVSNLDEQRYQKSCSQICKFLKAIANSTTSGAAELEPTSLEA